MIKFIKHFKTGFSLIEIILSITLSMILIVAPFMVYKKSMKIIILIQQLNNYYALYPRPEGHGFMELFG
jgi:type II secretory pathway component PulJ